MVFNFLALADIPINGETSKHLFLDVETIETGAALILRGEDSTLFPRAGAPLIWSNRDGTPKAFTIATGGASELLAIHGAIVGAYLAGNAETIAAAAKIPGALEVLAILAPKFPPFYFFAGNSSKRKCGSIELRNFARTLGRVSQPKKLPTIGQGTGETIADDTLAALIAESESKV